jgi:Leucine-rich repeat (LRR) protein
VAGTGSGVEVHLRGSVAYPDSTPAAGATVILAPLNDSGAALQTVTDADGKFAFDTLLPGDYVIEVLADSTHAALQEYSIDTTDSIVTLPPIIVQRLGALQGHVFLPASYADTTVTLSLRYGSRELRAVAADSVGRFAIMAVAAGGYDLYVEPGDTNFAAFMRAVVVMPGETTFVDIESLPASGQVLQDSGYVHDSLLVRAILDSNGLNALPVAAVADISESLRIVKLSLVDRGLWLLPPSIGGLDELVTLDVSNNTLFAIPEEIGRLKNLSTLILDQNSLSQLPGGLAGLTSLRRLRCDGNRFLAFPSAITELKGLEELSVCDNNLKLLPDSIGALVNLTTLFLDNNSLMTLPEALTRCSALRTLSAGRNYLKYLPDSIGNLANLEKLLVSSNYFPRLPASIGRLQRLIMLDASRGSLKWLPPQIGDLGSLRQLFLSEDSLTVLPNEIGRLAALAQLLLDHNQLVSLPDSIVNLQPVEGLDLRCNRICAVEDSTLIRWVDSWTRIDYWRGTQLCGPSRPIRLVYPNGGETLTEGDTVSIRWLVDRSLEKDALNLNVIFSGDNGISWQILPGIATMSADEDAGSLEWVVPAPEDVVPGAGGVLDECVLRVANYMDDYVVDVSDSLFTIAAK